MTAKIKHCPIEISGQKITMNLNVLPLGSYDVLVGTDWLESHWSLIDCKDKIVIFLIEVGERK